MMSFWSGWSGPSVGNWSPRVFTWGFFHLPLLPPAHPLVTLAKIDAHLQKNRLKRPKIKQGTTSNVNCILFNRLLRAKAGNFNLRSLNKCFSNYYQVRTRPVFAKTVTIVQQYVWWSGIGKALKNCYNSRKGAINS